MSNRILNLAAGAAVTASAAATAFSAITYQAGVQVGAVPEPITEASGLAASWANPGVLWTHNDSGDVNRVFALSAQGGGLLGTYQLTGASALDWEDIAVGPGPTAGASYLYVGDIGDNDANKLSISVYRVPEPSVPNGSPPVSANLSGVDKITLTYPDGSQDAESLMVDPLSGDIYVVTKHESQNSRVYRAPYPQSISGQTSLEFITTIGVVRATGGDISPDGDRILLRTREQAYQWSSPGGGELADAWLSPPQNVTLRAELRGEAIGFTALGASPAGFYTTSEGLNQPLYFYAAVPEPAAAALVLLVIYPLLRRT